MVRAAARQRELAESRFIIIVIALDARIPMAVLRLLAAMGWSIK